MSDQDRHMLDHEYDGIRELDNNLPEWWLALFALTIIFAFLYYIHYEVAGGPSTNEELATSLQAVQAMKKDGDVMTEEKLESLFGGEAVTEGRASFAAKCAACHRDDGGGLIGPNLTDGSWIHGKGSRVDIYGAIANGVPSMGMPAWKDMMPASELIAVSAFVHSLKGRNVPGGKPPQGNAVHDE